MPATSESISIESSASRQNGFVFSKRTVISESSRVQNKKKEKKKSRKINETCVCVHRGFLVENKKKKRTEKR